MKRKPKPEYKMSGDYEMCGCCGGSGDVPSMGDEPCRACLGSGRKRIIDKVLQDEEAVLDWDATIPEPPPKRKGTINVKLTYKGRSKPI